MVWVLLSTRLWQTNSAMSSAMTETRPPYRPSAATKLAATHPAKATAACPEGIPPANGLGECVTAFPNNTSKTTTPSATSVRLAGWRLKGSSVSSESGPRLSARTKYPTSTAPTLETSTAPAETSFESLASGWYSLVARSTANSSAVLNISVTNTNMITRTRAASSSLLTPKNRLPTSTTAAATTWKRMLRWVRTA